MKDLFQIGADRGRGGHPFEQDVSEALAPAPGLRK